MGSELDRVMQKYNIPNQGMAQTLGAMGRHGDSLVAHITPEEAMMLKRQGGAGTINPRTGLLEFFSGDNADSGTANTSGDSGGESVGVGDAGGPGFGGDPSAGYGNAPGGGYNDGTNDGGNLAPLGQTVNWSDLYSTKLGRDAESGALDFWTNYVNAHGLDSALAAFNYGAAQEMAARNQGAGTGTGTGTGTGAGTGTGTGTGTAPVTTPTPPVVAPPPTVAPTPFQYQPTYGFELNRLMRQYGVSTPTMMPFAGYTTQTTPEDARRAEYDKNVYQTYANQFSNNMANTNMYNQAQFLPDPTKFTPQYPAPISNPAYAPTNYGGIYNTYTKYFGRTPEEAGVQYWGKTGATGDALQSAILKGAQNADLEYLRSQYPDMKYARGGAVKTRYAEGGEVDPNEVVVTAPPIVLRKDTPTETPRPAAQSTTYGQELAEARRRSQAETDAFANMIRQMSERTESPASRAEMYFRLASAFGAPTKTGMFTENLALAGKEMGEYAKGRRTDEAERRALALKAQEVRMATAREDVTALKALAARELQPGSERERRIADMMSTHRIDRATASNIVDGVERISANPVTGEVTIVNLITGQSRPATSVLEGAARPAEGAQRPPRTLYELAAEPFTTGAAPAAAEGAQRVLGQVGVNVVPPEFTERRQTFLNVQNDIIRAVINNPRFPVAEQERIRREINIEPAAFTDPQTLLAKIRTLDTTLRMSLANREREGNDTLLPVEARRGARQAANDIRNLLATLGVPQERESAPPRPNQPSTTGNRPPEPRIGEVVDGYRYIGGGAGDRNNWVQESE